MMAQARRTRADMLAITRAKLISAGRATFGEIGYADAPMAEITAPVGLNRRPPLHPVAGKKGLLEAVVQQNQSQLHGASDQIRHTGQKPGQELPAGGHALL